MDHPVDPKQGSGEAAKPPHQRTQRMHGLTVEPAPPPEPLYFPDADTEPKAAAPEDVPPLVLGAILEPPASAPAPVPFSLPPPLGTMPPGLTPPAFPQPAPGGTLPPGSPPAPFVPPAPLPTLPAQPPPALFDGATPWEAPPPRATTLPPGAPAPRVPTVPPMAPPPAPGRPAVPRSTSGSHGAPIARIALRTVSGKQPSTPTLPPVVYAYPGDNPQAFPHVLLERLHAGQARLSAEQTYNLSRLDGTVSMVDLESLATGMSVEDLRLLVRQAWEAGLVTFHQP